MRRSTLMRVGGAMVLAAALTAGGQVPVAADDPGGRSAAAVPTTGWRMLSAGIMHTCGVTVTGAAYCWGRNGRLGILGSPTWLPTVTVPVPVTGLASGVMAVSAGSWHTCALTSAGAVLCWGYEGDGAGALGDGRSTGRSQRPVPVDGLSSGVVSISAGGEHTCAVTAAGGAVCWGKNSDGQLGDGGTTSSPVPVPVLGLQSGVASVSAAERHTCAVTVTGASLCWGFLLDATADRWAATPTPAPVAGLSAAASSVTTGDNWSFSCVVTVAGGVDCWGANSFGQLGNGTSGDDARSAVPVPATGLSSGIDSASAGYGHACAVTAAGSALCWGSNGSGQLGMGERSYDEASPVPVAGLSEPVVGVTSGNNHTCAALASGSAACWGANPHGELGNARRRGSAVPVTVARPENLAAFTVSAAGPGSGVRGQPVELTGSISPARPNARLVLLKRRPPGTYRPWARVGTGRTDATSHFTLSHTPGRGRRALYRVYLAPTMGSAPTASPEVEVVLRRG